MPGSPKKRSRRLALREAAALPPYVPEMNLSPVGSPPPYDPRFCKAVLDDAALGHTLSATAALIGVSQETMTEWRARHPEFDDAATRAGPIRQWVFEAHLIDLVRRGGDSTRFSAVWFALVNAAPEDWKDKPAAEASINFELGAPVQQPLALEPAQIDGGLVGHRNSGAPAQ